MWFNGITYLVAWLHLLGLWSTKNGAAEALEDKMYWLIKGQESIEDALKHRDISGVAKNSILFVGDGMGLSTITAARIFKGQRQGKTGEEGYLHFETFPHVALTKTYTVDRQVPDSAATATALFSGVKGNYYTVGLDSTAKFNVCDPKIEITSKVTTILEFAIAAGKSTGLVTTTRITHATPAAAYARSPHRDWECDSEIPEEELEKGCKDIARQLVEDRPGRDINVLFGGGKQVLNGEMQDNSSGACRRSDNKNLIKLWEHTQAELNRNFKFVEDWHDLHTIPKNVTHVLGLFADNHLSYDKDRDEGMDGEPSLSEMVQTAIEILQRNPKGFILIVEGGRIDHAHHDNLARVALEEVVAMDEAIEVARRKTKETETLIVVTADHGHSMSMNGYPNRGNPVEGIAGVTPEGFSYQTLSYINGPGYNYHRVYTPGQSENDSLRSAHTWRNLTSMDSSELLSRGLPHHAAYWMDFETHGGEDIPVYAVGPMAHLFRGVREQTYVASVISYATCIGHYSHFKQCRSPEPRKRNSNEPPVKGSAATVINEWFMNFQFLLLFTLWLELVS